MKIISNIILFKIVFIQLISVLVADQPYQASIWLRNKFNENSLVQPLCNGVIIHERLILTTATCLRNTTIVTANTTSSSSSNIDSNGILNMLNSTGKNLVGTNNSEYEMPSLNFVKLNASEIFILAGSDDDFIGSGIQLKQQKRSFHNVTEIEIAINFNSTSLENDIAILKLNNSLPLATRRDVQWISLDDHLAYKNSSCKIGFYNFMARNNQVIHTIKLMDNKNCTNTTYLQSPRKRDICSLYVSPNICNLSASELEESSDRGTGLVCDSKLIGLLSQIIPRENKTKCDTNSFKALYTRVALHLNWIYEKIAIESMIDLGKSNYVLAPPYKESAPSPHIQMSQFPEQLNNSIPSNSTVPATNRPLSMNNSNVSGLNDKQTDIKVDNKNLQQSQSPIQPQRKSNGIVTKSNILLITFTIIFCCLH